MKSQKAMSECPPAAGGAKDRHVGGAACMPCLGTVHSAVLLTHTQHCRNTITVARAQMLGKDGLKLCFVHSPLHAVSASTLCASKEPT